MIEKIRVYDSSEKITRKTVIFSDCMVITLDNPREKNNMPKGNSKKKYRRNNPYSWLVTASDNWNQTELREAVLRLSKPVGASSDWNQTELREALLCLAMQVDSDTLQEVFQHEMDDDGYFDPIK